MVVDFRRNRKPPTMPLMINRERASSFKYLGIHISEDTTWNNTQTITKKAQKQLNFL